MNHNSIEINPKYGQMIPNGDEFHYLECVRRESFASFPCTARGEVREG